MSDRESSFLSAMKALVRERGGERVYPCIEDLLEHGLTPTRFTRDEYPPGRQDVTQYLAAWSRHAGLSADECRGWMIDFCGVVLASISRRTFAGIRHSTLANISYIYGWEVPFLCKGEQNIYRARCSPECPLYAEAQARVAANPDEPWPPRMRFPPSYVPPPPPPPPVKVRHREQFERAVQLIRDEVAKGTRPARLLELLQELGFKSRTGRKWTASMLARELVRVRGPRRGKLLPAGAAPRPSTPDEPGDER